MKNPSSGEPPQRSGDLRSGALNTRHLVFFVVAAAAPLTTIGGFAPLAFGVGGQASPVGYLIAGLVYALFAVGFTAMSRYVRTGGAFYAYIAQGLGRIMGGGAALVAYVGYTLGEIGFCSAAGLFASTAINDLTGVSVPWQLCAIAIGLGVGVVSYCRVDVGARFLACLLAGEIGILVVLAAAIVLHGTPEGFSLQGFDPTTWSASAMGSLFIITFVVYVGFEQTAVYAEEVKDAPRTVPRATYIAVALLAVLYTFMSWILLMAIGPSALPQFLTSGDPSTLVIGINAHYLGSAMSTVMEILIVTSFIAGVLALQNAGARYLFNMGREGLLSTRLARTNTGSASPSTAVIVQTILVVVTVIGFGLSGLDPYTQVVIWTSTPTLVAVLALQLLTSVAVVRFFARQTHQVNIWHRLVAPALSALALGGVLVLICAKMDLLTGLDPLGNILINLPLLVAFVWGVLRARVLSTSTLTPVPSGDGERVQECA